LIQKFKHPLPKLLVFASVLFFSMSLFAQQQPFTGSPTLLPGILEAEDFDIGGEGIAYHDIDTGNNGGYYRDTDVDIENSSTGGFNVGWINPGEWLEYTVDVTTSGPYQVTVLAASGTTGSFHVEFEGIDLTGSMMVEATGGWQSWISIISEDVWLDAGQQLVRVVMDVGAFNLDRFEFTHAYVPDPPSVEITSPLDNTAFFHGQDVPITASAVDSNGIVELVEFFADDEKIGEDNSEPFEILWQSPEIGNWDLTAVATDNDGGRDTSEKVDISVNFPEYDYSVNFSSVDPFHEAGFNLVLSCELAGADIWYTLDGSNPLDGDAALVGGSPLEVLVHPLNTMGGRGLTPGVTVRAVLMNGNVQQSRISTHSYIFIESVKTQHYPGGAWPVGNMNGQIIDYDVNQDVINHPDYSDIIDDALLDIPSISLVTDLDNLFDAQTGIYVNAPYHGREWERPVSVELLNPDGSPGFQIDAGLRIRGGWSRHGEFPKHSFRLFFREDYGQDKLEFPLFDDEGVDEFKKVDLRTSQNYAWSNGFIWENTMNRDVFSRDLQAVMGQPYTRSRYYHLYLNGMYWGLYQTQERPEANFAESYLGGNDNDYDVVKVDIGEDWNLYEIEATDGNLDGWESVWDACQTGFASNDAYFALEAKLANGSDDNSGSKLVDIDNLIDYMLIIFYTGNIDAPVSKFRGDYSPNNFYALYNRDANDGFIFLTHDSEHTLLVNQHWPSIGLEEDRVNISPVVDRFEIFHPQWLHLRLAENQEYRLRFADAVYRHFYNAGVMTPDHLSDLFLRSAADIDLAIIGESMRWGDLDRSRNNAWQPAIDLITNNFFPQRGEIVLDQLRAAALYPNLDPPLYKLDGTTLLESTFQIDDATQIEFVNSEPSTGFIVYTLDGSDPRLVGGGFAPGAHTIENHGTISIDETTVIKTRLINGGEWSALHELTLQNQLDISDLLLSEIHYHPLDEGEISGSYYEFLELFNAGAYALNLALVTFSDGIEYTFPLGTILEAGEYLVVASHAPSFEQRYGFSPFDEFAAQLDNAGERLVLESSSGDTIINVRYDDQAPWPEAADGDGPSLTWTGAAENGNLEDPLNWAASSMIHGSPGVADPVSIISEAPALPNHFSLSQNYPNPFNPSTSIRFGLADKSAVSLVIYDIQGRQVKSLFTGIKAAGWHEQNWNGMDDAGQVVATGVYFTRLQSEAFTKTIKMLLIK